MGTGSIETLHAQHNDSYVFLLIKMFQENMGGANINTHTGTTQRLILRPIHIYQIARAYSFLLRCPGCEHPCTDLLHPPTGHYIYWRRRCARGRRDCGAAAFLFMWRFSKAMDLLSTVYLTGLAFPSLIWNYIGIRKLYSAWFFNQFGITRLIMSSRASGHRK
jgi:hypothetical protein